MKSESLDLSPRGAPPDVRGWWNGLTRRLSDMPQPDARARDAARRRQENLTKPPGSLGRLEELAIWLAGWQGREIPELDRVHALVFAGNHGVVAQGVSPYPASVTAQMVKNFEKGGAAICRICRTYNIRLSVVPMSLDIPTGDITLREAMTIEDCLAAFGRGMESVPERSDALVIGEMGIGNTTIAAALANVLLGGKAKDWAGPGTGLDAEGISRKAAVVKTAVKLHGLDGAHPFELLRRLGGREVAAMCGAILQARLNRIPVFLDGYVCGASALVLERSNEGVLDHCVAAHVSAEPGHRRMLDALGMKPLLDLDMRLGEGTGAAMAVGIARGALATHAGMATFTQAGIDGPA